MSESQLPEVETTEKLAEGCFKRDSFQGVTCQGSALRRRGAYQWEKRQRRLSWPANEEALPLLKKLWSECPTGGLCKTCDIDEERELTSNSCQSWRTRCHPNTVPIRLELSNPLFLSCFPPYSVPPTPLPSTLTLMEEETSLGSREKGKNSKK